MKKIVLILAALCVTAAPAWAMQIVVQKSTGEVIQHSGTAHPSAAQMIGIASRNYGIAASDLAAYAVTDPSTVAAWADLSRDSLGATMEGGVVVAVEQVGTPTVYLHFSISGGDGETPPGAPIDGSDPLIVSVALRQGADPASPVIPVTRTWRITIRDESGGVYDVRRITLTSGEVGPVNYSGNGRPGVCEIRESDFEKVTHNGTDYTVKIVGDLTFKFYSDF